MLDTTYPGETWELVAAIVIIFMTCLVLYFLFKNVMKEIKKEKNDRKLLKTKQDEGENASNKQAKLISESKTISKKSKDIVGLIDQEIRHTKEGAISVLFFMNLDNFRFIVDKYDQKEVDKIILEIEKRLKRTQSKSSICGHYEDDIFICYLSGKIDNDVIQRSAQELLLMVSEPLKSVAENITTSIGIVVFPYDGINATQLIKNAEIALYVSKKEGKNRFALYSEDLIEKEQFNINYYQEIKKSISHDEFLLYYQPIVDIKTGKIIGLESLLRWNHPTMGILPPGKFLNVMDLTGDITWFGTWGFEKVVSQYVNWKKQFRVKDVFISINLSPKQLMVQNLAKSFFDIVKKHEVTTEIFCLEILDYYTIIKNPIAIHNLGEFRKFGFRIAIDDLGDQFELVTDMDSIQATIIKISREDVLKIMNDFPESDQIQRVIQFAMKKQKIVIAEGIEDEIMIQKIADLDVRFLQGYFFSPPKSTEDVTQMLKKSPWDMNTFDKFYK